MSNPERTFEEITFPIGTFRAYDDNPYQWIQISGRNVVHLIEDAYESGQLKPKKK